jgi:predicted dehydrogenase
VGFNFIVEVARRNLKQRILDGEFGVLQRVSFLGHWPRPASYFTRAPWAGRIRVNQQLVLDSCIGNAMAHYIHNLLFWGGTREMFDWASVTQMDAELSRAHAIENYDTILARGALDSGAEFRIAATHASKGQQYHYEVVHCERATITYYTGAEWHVDWKDGSRESGAADRGDLLARNFEEYFRYVRGEATRPLTRLEDTRPFVHLTNLVYAAAGGIETEEEQFIERDGEWVAVRDIVDIMETFMAHPFERQSVPAAQTDTVVELDAALDRIAG